MDNFNPQFAKIGDILVHNKVISEDQLNKALAEQKGYDFKYFMLDEDFTREELFEKFPGARTFPQIKVHGENIGGYTEFEQWSNGLRRV